MLINLKKHIVSPYDLPEGALLTPKGSPYDEEMKRRLKTLGYID